MTDFKYRKLLVFPLLLALLFSANAQSDPLPLPENTHRNTIRAIESYQEQQKLTPPEDDDTVSSFGYAVALDGNTALIGTESSRDAYVYEFIDGIWTFQQELLASADASLFGTAVALEGDTAFVGAYGDERVFAYTRTDGVWSFPPQVLVASDGAPGDAFGWSISLSGDSVLIGANFDDANTGSGYVFTRSGGSWSEQAKLVADDRAPDDYFGYSVSLSGDTALIGAYGDEAFTGSAYVFTRSSDIWTQQQKLTASDGLGGDAFGWSVALDTDTALVSALGDDDLTGSAYVFTRTIDTWSEQQKLVASDASTFEQFGISVSLDGDKALIGAYDDDGSRGSAYIFTRSVDTWSQQQKLIAIAREPNDYFGYSVSLDAETALIGAYGADPDGATYVFELGSSLEVELSADTASIIEGNSGTSVTGLSLLVSGGVSAATNSVDITVTDDTATSADNDYSQTNATVTIPAGDYTTVQTIAIPVEALGIVGDTNFETDETLTLSLSNVGAYAEIGDANGDATTQSSATVTIINDDEPLEVLTNGGFEGEPQPGKIPEGWNGRDTKLFRKDKQKCNKDKNGDNIIDKFVANSGDCAFLFKGNPTGERTKLNQKFSDLSPFTDGATLTLSVFVDKRSTKVGHPFGKLIVKYLNGDKTRVVLRIPDADGYTLVSDSLTINLNGSSLDVVKVSFRNRLTSGKFFIDDASLTATPATALKQQREVLPMPDAPEGFRD